MKIQAFRFGWPARAVAVAALAATLRGAVCPASEQAPLLARVEVHAGRQGCTAELDSTPSGITDAKGNLVLGAVEPGDHYLHIRCRDQQGKAYFISPRAEQTLEIRHGIEGVSTSDRASSLLGPAEIRIQLRRHIQEAVQLRAQGRVEKAIEHLRSAFELDPENSDLHREMGITFLQAKEWKRARVEMLEAVRHDPTDADAHNGLGYALEKLGDLERALAEYRTAARLEPHDSTYRRRYIETLAKLSAQQAMKKK